MNDINILKKELIDVCKLMYSKNLISATDGNLSIKIDDERILATPSRVNKGLLTEDMLVVTDFEGRVIEGNYRSTSEMRLHTKVYREREDMRAVIHSHPPYSTAFALAGEPIAEDYLIETLVILGNISLAPYATPSTDEVPQSMDGLIQTSDIILLQNHGVVVCGEDIIDALNKIEALENVAKTIILSEVIGTPQKISQEKIDYLREIRGERKN